MNSIYHTDFPLTIRNEETGEDTEVECSFHFFEAWQGSYFDPPEPSSIEIVDITYKGKSIINSLSSWEYEAIQDELLSCMLKIY